MYDQSSPASQQADGIGSLSPPNPPIFGRTENGSCGIKILYYIHYKTVPGLAPNVDRCTRTKDRDKIMTRLCCSISLNFQYIFSWWHHSRMLNQLNLSVCYSLSTDDVVPVTAQIDYGKYRWQHSSTSLFTNWRGTHWWPTNTRVCYNIHMGWHFLNNIRKIFMKIWILVIVANLTTPINIFN